MKVILLSDVRKVGRKYEMKDVSDGYALNFLIPRKLAEVATQSTIKKLEQKKAEDQKREKAEIEAITKELSTLKGTALLITAKANEKGHLFSSISKEDLASAIKKERGVTVPLHYIALEKPIKEVGDRNVDVNMGDASVTLAVSIKAEE